MSCNCGESSPPIKATLATGEQVSIHPLVDRECGDAGMGGTICPRPTLVVQGEERPFETRFVGKS